MAVEIRELVIKGFIQGKNLKSSLNENNIELLQTNFANKLKAEIIQECTETILDKLERRNYL